MELKKNYFNGAIFTSNKELRKSAGKWKKILSLSEWDIQVELGEIDPDDDHVGGALGLCTYNILTRQAYIKIMSPEYYQDMVDSHPSYEGGSPARFKFDMETALVHELLHVNFAYITDFMTTCLTEKMSLSYELSHQVLHDIARALVTVERKKTA